MFPSEGGDNGGDRYCHCVLTSWFLYWADIAVGDTRERKRGREGWDEQVMNIWWALHLEKSNHVLDVLLDGLILRWIERKNMLTIIYNNYGIHRKYSWTTNVFVLNRPLLNMRALMKDRHNGNRETQIWKVITQVTIRNDRTKDCWRSKEGKNSILSV